MIHEIQSQYEELLHNIINHNVDVVFNCGAKEKDSLQSRGRSV